MTATAWKPGLVEALLLSLVISIVLSTVRTLGTLGWLPHPDAPPRRSRRASAPLATPNTDHD